VTRKPLITKLSPNQTDIRENARRCIEAGSDGLAVINTIMGMAIDVQTRRPVIGNVQGGLSGPAIKPIALLKVMQVAEVARPLGIPIIGQGGITTAQDALEFIIAGAATVGVGTALFYDPLACRKVNDGIATYLRAGSRVRRGALRHARPAEAPDRGPILLSGPADPRIASMPSDRPARARRRDARDPAPRRKDDHRGTYGRTRCGRRLHDRTPVVPRAIPRHDRRGRGCYGGRCSARRDRRDATAAAGCAATPAGAIDTTAAAGIVTEAANADLAGIPT
jgi:hypothetical protein